MNKLEEARIKIDDIDSKIIELYELRMEVVKEVINYKIENNLPILDSSRENLMLDKNLKKIKSEDYKKYYYNVLNGYLNASKDMQKDILDNKKGVK